MPTPLPHSLLVFLSFFSLDQNVYDYQADLQNAKNHETRTGTRSPEKTRFGGSKVTDTKNTRREIMAVISQQPKV